MALQRIRVSCDVVFDDGDTDPKAAARSMLDEFAAVASELLTQDGVFEENTFLDVSDFTASPPIEVEESGEGYAVKRPAPHEQTAWLPEPDANGVYVYPDGCKIWKARTTRAGKPLWKACWDAESHNTMLTGDDQGGEGISLFESPEEAAECLLHGEEGPWIGPKTSGPTTADNDVS